MNVQEHAFAPLTVAATLLARAADKDGGLVRESDGSLSTPYRTLGADPLFQLSAGSEGEFTLRRGPAVYKGKFVAPVEPDPLWQSAHDICRHMEADHADTFELFVEWRGGRVGQGVLTMPWVDREGFVLVEDLPDSAPYWIPFRGDCSTPNLVRKEMIQLLKEIRR